MPIIYAFVALIATILGSIAGLGGGVIIKPVLDSLSHYNLSTIGVLSSCTVLSMAIVSTIKQVRNGFIVEKRMVFLAVGSVLGGVLGEEIFSIFVAIIDPNIAKGIQSLILAGLLILVLLKKYLPSFNIKNTLVIVILGILLGTVASFLGIGGGSINVALLCMLLGMNIKDAAVNSIFIILFSQVSKLTAITFDTGFSDYDLSMLLYMILGGVIGGLVGSNLNRKLTSNTINKIFNLTLFFVILLNLFNAVTFL